MSTSFQDWQEEPIEGGQMRTVCLENLPPQTTLEEILDQIRGGIVEQTQYHADVGICFVTFLDAMVAAGLHAEAQSRRMVIGGNDIMVSWGKPTHIPPAVVHAVMNGATRNVFIGNIDAEVTEAFLRRELLRFGMVDHVKILYEKRIAFVHMAGIPQAMRAVGCLQLEPAWMLRRVHYGRDRCAPSGLNPLLSLPQSLIGAHLRKSGDPTCLLAPLNSPGNIPNRTIYVGGIHPDVTTKDICDTIRGGILQHIKYMAEKNIAFVTFVDAECANQFYDRCQLEGLVFKGKRVKVGWGKATPLPTSVQLAVHQNLASRNVYIGSIDDLMTESRLLRDFGDFGDIELINIIPDKNIAFVNFTDILSAIRAVEVMKNALEYQRFKINYGKDRCGNAPRAPRPVSHLQTYQDPYPNEPIMHSIPSYPDLGYQSKYEKYDSGFLTTPFYDQLLGNSSNTLCDWNTRSVTPPTPKRSSLLSLQNDYSDIRPNQKLPDTGSDYDSMLGLFNRYSFQDNYYSRSQTQSPMPISTEKPTLGNGILSVNQTHSNSSATLANVPMNLGSGVYNGAFSGVKPIGSNRAQTNSPGFPNLMERQYSSPSPW